METLAADVLDVEGRLLAQHKAFTRTNLIAEIAPRLYGRDPTDLDRVLDHILTSQEIVPLIGVAGAREQAYTTAQVLQTEATIANVAESLTERTGPALSIEQITAAISAAEGARGHQLTGGQRRVVERICGSGQAISVVVGVAGSGKTTALDTATSALEAAGYRVLGTSTSGQAARTLGDEAGVEARTFASLLWRLDHGQTTLDDRTVVVVDEAGMADDANLARLALAVERSRSSMVLVGDHYQLDAVGPGGALAALLRRRPDLVVNLDANVRQRDPDERHALAELRAGSVPKAVAWYARNDRIKVEADRLATIVSMVGSWSADVASGHDTALLAWRRQDVADLNRLARERWDQLGRLEGDDVEVSSGHCYAVGDRIVALAPNPHAGIVTSQPLTVVNVDQGAMVVRTAEGRETTITGDGLDGQHLGYGYAVTVHRSQGATFDRAHVLAAGGGRELAYVALSRARDRTVIHATADDFAQAIDDLQADWGVTRHQRWITDTPARPGHEPVPDRFRRARTVPPPKVSAVSAAERRADAQRRLIDLHQDLDDLLAGTGRWTNTPAGEAARSYDAAVEQLEEMRRMVGAPETRRRERRAAAKSLPALEKVVEEATAQWNLVGQPEVDRLSAETEKVRQDHARLAREVQLERLDHLQTRDLASRGPDRGFDIG